MSVAVRDGLVLFPYGQSFVALQHILYMNQRNSSCIEPNLFLGLSGTVLKVQKKARVVIKQKRNLNDSVGGGILPGGVLGMNLVKSPPVLLLQRQIRCLGTY